MAAMLRGLKMFDGIAFEEVPEQFKQGLACQEHFNLVAADRTADKVAARAAEIAVASATAPLTQVINGLCYAAVADRD